MKMARPKFQCQTMHVHHYTHSKTKIPQDSPYPWTQPIREKNNQMLSEEVSAEKLDVNNQKRLQKLLANFYIMLEQ